MYEKLLLAIWCICLTSSNPGDQRIIHSIWTQLSLPYNMFACNSTHRCNTLIHSSRCSWCLQAKEGEPFVVRGEHRGHLLNIHSPDEPFIEILRLSPRYLKEMQSQFELENEKHVHMVLVSRFSCFIFCVCECVFQPTMYFSWKKLIRPVCLAYGAINI